MKYKVGDKVSFKQDITGFPYTVYKIKEIDDDCLIAIRPYGMFYNEKLFNEAVEKKLYTFTVPLDTSETKTQYKGIDCEVLYQEYLKVKELENKVAEHKKHIDGLQGIVQDLYHKFAKFGTKMDYCRKELDMMIGEIDSELD